MGSMAAATDIGVYREALVFLGTAGVVIPLMARLRISPVLGFLVAGLVLGPHSLGRLGADLPWLGWITITSQDAVDRLAELGVAFLLFTIGLELSFDRLWTMRRLVFGLGMSQVVLTTAAISAHRVRLRQHGRSQPGDRRLPGAVLDRDRAAAAGRAEAAGDRSPGAASSRCCWRRISRWCRSCS